jgi:hypothetical protein
MMLVMAGKFKVKATLTCIWPIFDLKELGALFLELVGKRSLPGDSILIGDSHSFHFLHGFFGKLLKFIDVRSQWDVVLKRK